MTEMSERKLVRHVGRVYDSIRWEGLRVAGRRRRHQHPARVRDDLDADVCALLILQDAELSVPLADLSPWLDMLTRSRKQIVALLDAQQHRRFIKTHMPLSGLPIRDGVTFICVARDPRDVALSMDDHLFTLDWEAFHRLRVAAALHDGLPEPEMAPVPPLDEQTGRERVWRWVDDDTPPEKTASSLLRTLRHIESICRADDGRKRHRRLLLQAVIPALPGVPEAVARRAT